MLEALLSFLLKLDRHAGIIRIRFDAFPLTQILNMYLMV